MGASYNDTAPQTSAKQRTLIQRCHCFLCEIPPPPEISILLLIMFIFGFGYTPVVSYEAALMELPTTMGKIPSICVLAMDVTMRGGDSAGNPIMMGK